MNQCGIYSWSTILHGACTWLHPESQESIFNYDRSMGHYEIAMNCAGRYFAYMGTALFIASVVVTVVNPHTRGMLPWIIRNPMGLEVN